jgi:hypothetical protein
MRANAPPAAVAYAKANALPAATFPMEDYVAAASEPATTPFAENPAIANPAFVTAPPAREDPITTRLPVLATSPMVSVYVIDFSISFDSCFNLIPSLYGSAWSSL